MSNPTVGGLFQQYLPVFSARFKMPVDRIKPIIRLVSLALAEPVRH